MRTSPIYYIAPSAISITPNCNGSANDLAVYIANGTKIKVYEPRISGLGYKSEVFQEWTLTGKNRRLANSGEHGIYARLSKTEKTAYLVFSVNEYVLTPNTKTFPRRMEGSDGHVYDWPALTPEQADKHEYWWVRLGSVSAVVDGERTVTLDTGILGTDQYNTQWLQNPDTLPYRMSVLLTSGGSTAEVLTDPVMWGRSVDAVCRLTQGWDTAAEADHWTINRETEYSEDDSTWNATAAQRTTLIGGVEKTFAECGRITLHFDDVSNDFGELGTATFFAFTAYDADGNVLAVKTVNIPHEDLGTWQVDMDTQSFAIMVDDCGNVRGGLWTEEEDDNGQTFRTYRLHTAVTVRRKNKYLTLAPAGTNPGIGQYQIYPQSGDCTLMVSNGTVYVTGILNVKDGVAGTSDDVQTDAWYDAMRRMKEAMVTFTVVCEGAYSEIKSVPIAIGHIDTSLVDVQLAPAVVTVRRNPTTGAVSGLPVQSEVIVGEVEGSVQPTIEGVTLDIGGVQVSWTEQMGRNKRYATAAGWDVRYNETETATPDSPEELELGHPILALYGVPASYAGAAAMLGLTVQLKYSGISYEYRKTFSVGLVNDGEPAVDYRIETSQDNVIIASDSTSAQVSITASFLKRVGQQPEESYACYYAFYRRVGSTYTRIADSGDGKYTSRTLETTVSSNSSNANYAEALVLFISDSALNASALQSSLPAVYLAKQEITIQKQGDTGRQGNPGAAAVNYRCRWQLSGVEVQTLAAAYTGVLKNVSAQNPTLTATLIKRVGNNAEAVVSGSGTIAITAGDYSSTNDVLDGQMTRVVQLTESMGEILNSNSVKQVLATFALTDETLTYSIDKVMDGASITGATGPIPIPYGQYNVNSTYTRSADMVPYVWQVVGGARKYYILVSSTAWTGSEQSSSTNTPANDILENSTAASWQEIPNFPYLQTEVLMAEMGTFGAWTFWGDYMFSNQGRGLLGCPTDAGGSFIPNLIFDASTGNIKAAAGNCVLNGDGSVYIAGDIRAHTGAFSGHIKSEATVIHSHNITHYVRLEINPFTGEPQFMLDLDKIGRNVIFYATSAACDEVPTFAESSLADGDGTGILLDPQGYGSITGTLQSMASSVYGLNPTIFGSIIFAILLPYVYRNDRGADHDYSAIVKQYGNGNLGDAMRNLYRRWRWEKGDSFTTVLDYVEAPSSRPYQISSAEWDEWRIYPYRTYMQMYRRARAFVGAEITFMQCCGNLDFPMLEIYGAHGTVSSNSNEQNPNAWEPVVFGGDKGSVDIYKSTQATGTAPNLDSIYWDKTSENGATIAFWDRYTLELDDQYVSSSS